MTNALPGPLVVVHTILLAWGIVGMADWLLTDDG